MLLARQADTFFVEVVDVHGAAGGLVTSSPRGKPPEAAFGAHDHTRLTWRPERPRPHRAAAKPISHTDGTPDAVSPLRPHGTSEAADDSDATPVKHTAAGAATAATTDHSSVSASASPVTGRRSGDAFSPLGAHQGTPSSRRSSAGVGIAAAIAATPIDAPSADRGRALVDGAMSATASVAASPAAAPSAARRRTTFGVSVVANGASMTSSAPGSPSMASPGCSARAAARTGTTVPLLRRQRSRSHLNTTESVSWLGGCVLLVRLVWLATLLAAEARFGSRQRCPCVQRCCRCDVTVRSDRAGVPAVVSLRARHLAGLDVLGGRVCDRHGGLQGQDR